MALPKLMSADQAYFIVRVLLQDPVLPLGFDLHFAITEHCIEHPTTQSVRVQGTPCVGVFKPTAVA